MPTLNTFNKTNWVTMKGLDMLLNKLQFGGYFDTSFNENYGKPFAVGATITVPLTQRYITQRNNLAYTPQALSRPTTTITIDQTSTAAFDWESIEKALDMERGDERAQSIYVKPAINQIRQDYDSDLAQFAYQRCNMITGALGTNPSTFDGTSAAARQLLLDMGLDVDSEDVGLMLPPAVIRSVKNSTLLAFNPQSDMSRQQRTGMVTVSDGVTWYASNSLWTHTAGTWAGAVTMSVANQQGASITLACTTGDTFKAGDKFSIANVNQVNLMTRRTTSTSGAGSKTFTNLTDQTGVASAVTLSIYPAINGPGSQYQNVDALPAAGAALTLWPGTVAPNGKSGKVGVAINSGAFMLVGVKLELPEAVEVKSQTQDPDTQLSLRFIRAWDQNNSRMTNRLDTAWGRGVGLAEQCAVAIACG